MYKAIALAAPILLALAAEAAQQRAELSVTADTGICYVRGKGRFSNGAGPTSPLRQNQNWSGFESKVLLMAFDTRAISGWTVERANLHVTVARGDLYGVGLCTILAPWAEGRADNWQERPGAPCWDFARCPRDGAQPTDKNLWAWPGSRFYSVAWAHPHARYSHAGPGRLVKKTAADGRFVHLTIPVDPALVESLAVGAAYGLVMTDDKGQVAEGYSLHGSGRPYHYDESQDVYVFTREAHLPEFRPRLEVFGGPVDKTPPGRPERLAVREVRAAEGVAELEFAPPGDDGLRGQALAYEAVWSATPIDEGNWSRATPLPRWSLPNPQSGQVQRMPVFTLAAGDYHVAIRAVDEAGNRGPVADVALTIPAAPAGGLARVEGAPRRAWRMDAAAAQDLNVFACPETVKIDPASGAVLRDENAYRHIDGYALANEVWRAQTRTVALQASRNEVAAFKVIVAKTTRPLSGVRVSVSDLAGPGGARIAADPNVQRFRVWYVRTGSRPPARSGPGGPWAPKMRPSAWHGDACLPLRRPLPETFSVPSDDNRVPDQKYQAAWVDVYVPRDAAPGAYAGKVTVSAEGLDGPVEIALKLEVLPLTLPDELSWRVEMNRYGPLTGYAGVGPERAVEAERMYHSLAKQHRVTINSLPYGQSGGVYEGLAPVLAGEGANLHVADWRAWDERFGPLLDGTAFSATAGYVGPGAGLPISHMYLPFCENWPVPLDGRSYGDYAKLPDRVAFAEWAKRSRRCKEAFTAAHQAGYRRVARDFIEHFKEKGWTGTRFQFFYNNKYYFKCNFFGDGFGGYGSSFWLLDEPVDFDDYDANAFFLGLCRDGWKAAGAPQVQAEYRTDVSQPHGTRGLWDGLCNLWNSSGYRGFAPTARIRQLWLPGEQYWQYGRRAGTSAPHVETMRSFLNSWCSGTVGEVPYWNFGRGNWRAADDLAVIWSGRGYAGGKVDYAGPIAGARLKILRRAQQDLEYLHLLAARPGWDRARVRRALAAWSGQAGSPSPNFDGLSLDKWAELRRAVVSTILAGPAPAPAPAGGGK